MGEAAAVEVRSFFFLFRFVFFSCLCFRSLNLSLSPSFLKQSIQSQQLLAAAGAAGDGGAGGADERSKRWGWGEAREQEEKHFLPSSLSSLSFSLLFLSMFSPLSFPSLGSFCNVA